MKLNEHQVFSLHPGVSGLWSDDEQVAAVLTAKGRIAAATYRITLALSPKTHDRLGDAQKIALFAPESTSQTQPRSVYALLYSQRL